MTFKKIYNPTIRIAFKREDNTVKLDYKQLVAIIRTIKREDNTVKLDYKQLVAIIRTIVFEKQFLIELKNAMREL